jgi:hypothetical protein
MYEMEGPRGLAARIADCSAVLRRQASHQCQKPA